MRITVPSSLSIQSSSRFILELENHLEADEIILDFSSLRFALPAGTLVLASGLREFRRRRKQGLSNQVIIDKSNEAQSYLMHIGFFKHIGIFVGNDTGEASGSYSYKPITCTKKYDIINEAASKGVREIEVILDKSDEIASWFTSSFNQSSYRTLSYAIRESIRNVFDHAQTKQFFYLGQKYRTGKIEFAFADEGRGLLSSLREAFPVLSSDNEAIELSIKPGATRRLGQDPRSNVSDNSGFGLYVLSELGRSFGQFTLSSGSATLVSKKSGTSVFHSQFKGTFVSLRFDSLPLDWGPLLENIIQAGEEEAETLGYMSEASGLTKTPSKENFPTKQSK